MKIDTKYLKRLRTLGFIEGVSTLVLFFVAMPMKYLGGVAMAVSVVGPIHGFLFMALAAGFYLGIEKVPMPPRMAWMGIGAAILPFGPFIFDRRLVALERTGSTE